MEPQLISRKAIKKILKKKYFTEDNIFNKSFSSFIYTVKLNWLPIIIILVAIALLVHLFIENRNNKDALKLEQDKFEGEQTKERFSDYDDFKQKPDYESEYYKMLPRVTSNPEVIDYMYQS